jgi:4-oxalocrotonate tautomerase
VPVLCVTRSLPAKTKEFAMPLVRISHISGKSPEEIEALSKGVHLAMVETFGVPEQDFFQIITAHPAKTGPIGPDNFLGVAHTKNLVFVQVTCAEGRNTEQKKALYTAIVKKLGAGGNVRPEDIIINLVETKRENWSFGNGLAPFA